MLRTIIELGFAQPSVLLQWRRGAMGRALLVARLFAHGLLLRIQSFFSNIPAMDAPLKSLKIPSPIVCKRILHGVVLFQSVR